MQLTKSFPSEIRRAIFSLALLALPIASVLAAYPNNIDDSLDQQCPWPARGAAGSLPSWSVSEPYLNLWLSVRPVFYRTSSDGDFGPILSYKQRDTRNGDTISFGFGPNWECNWLSYVEYNEEN